MMIKDESRMDNTWTQTTLGTRQRSKASKTKNKIKTTPVYKHKDGRFQMPDHLRLSSHIT